MNISDSSASTNSKKLAFLHIQSSNCILHILSCNFTPQRQSSRFFRRIVQFQVIKNLLKKSKITSKIEEFWLILKK
eukprot:UN12446